MGSRREAIAAADRWLIDERELARLTGQSVRTVQKARITGTGFPFIKLPGSRSVRYDLQDVLGAIEAGKRRSTSDPGPGADDAGR